MTEERSHPELSPLASLRALATRALDEGAYERVLTLYESAKQANLTPEEAARWRRILLEAGEFAAAEEAAMLSGITEEDDKPSREVGSAGSDDLLDFEPGQREAETDEPPPASVATFLRFFGGRGDVYARQWYDARRDRSGYWPVREQLTHRVAADHLLGRITIGQYVLHPDETVSFSVIDLDPTAEALEQIFVAGEVATGLSYPPLGEYLRRLIEVASEHGLAPVGEDTGGVGLHFWLFFAPRLAAQRARALLRELLWRAGPQPPGVNVEIFPKQDHLSGKGLGNLVKLPLGIHQATGRVSCFLDLELRPVALDEGLRLLQPSDPAAIERLLASKVTPLPSGTIADGSEPRLQGPLRAPSGPSPRKLAEALAAIPAGRETDRAVDRILEGCVVLRELARQAHEERSLPTEGARALLYTVGLVGRENRRIEELFQNAGVSRKELERVRKGLQSPTGCKRLRERFASLAAACRCPDPPQGGYSTPALFAFREPPRFERTPSPWVQNVALEDATVPTDLEQRLARIEALLSQLKADRGGRE